MFYPRKGFLPFNYDLFIFTQISQCFKRIGAADSDTDVILLEICHQDDKSALDELKSRVSGTEVEISQLPSMRNEEEIKKLYKVTEEELEIGTLTDAVVSRMATKSFVSYS